MAKFIRVHDVEGNLPVIINADEIVYIYFDNTKKKSIIRVNGGIQCMVHETQDSIFEMLNS